MFAAETEIPAWVTLAGLGAAVLSAFAAMWSAVQSHRSAAASRKDAAAARDALAWIIKPNVVPRPTKRGRSPEQPADRRAVVVENLATPNATDLELKVVMRTGQTLSDSWPLLEGVVDALGKTREPPSVEIGLGLLPDGQPTWFEDLAQVTLRFRDQHRLMCWERRYDMQVVRVEDPPSFVLTHDVRLE